MSLHSMDMEEPFKLGFLFTPPQSFLRKSWVKRFCALYNVSGHGIQRLEIFDNDTAFLKQSKSPTKIIPLTDCVKVTPSPQKQQANVFEVCTKTGSHQFSADSFQEMTEWLTALQTVAFNPVSSFGIGQYNVQDVKQEENMLYSSMDEPEIYLVKSLNTDAMIRNNLHGDYKLIITTVSIAISEEKFQHKIGKAILTWPYRHIRRYGCSKDNFSFEAGRKCSSGEGLFAFSSPDGSIIFQSVDAHVASLKLSQSDSEIPSSPLCDGDQSSVFLFKEDSNLKPDEETIVNSITVPKKNVTSFDKTAKNINEKAQLSLGRVLAKSSQPMSKPPRKSKASTYVNVQHEDSDTSPMFRVKNYVDGNISQAANIYEDPADDFSDVVHQSQLAENIHPHSIMYEPVYAVLEIESINNSNLVELEEKVKNVQLGDSTSNNSAKNCTEQSSNNHSNRGSDSYDHLFMQKFEHSKMPHRNSSDHVYGKLLGNRQISSTPNSSFGHSAMKTMQNDFSEQSLNESDHCYTNVKIKSSAKHLSSIDSEPKHFLQNDAEYARVNKTKK